VRRVPSREVGVVERRSEEQGVEAASSATQLAVRQSVVPLCVSRTHPVHGRNCSCLGRIAVSDRVGPRLIRVDLDEVEAKIIHTVPTVNGQA
jgi:hypothetical protein